MSTKVTKLIYEEIKTSKYYSIVVDSTPNITHQDQLTFVIRYISKNSIPAEQFITFLKIESHKLSDLEINNLNLIQKFGTDIKNCRGQCYDNAANMSGVYSGLQARLKKHVKESVFVPYSDHSLNLVGICAAESCSVDFFIFVQQLYNFFSGSTARWEVIIKNLKTCSVEKN